jgi:cation diffusion facilitator CzcD-associated flavoprotein CzcO
MTMTHGTPRIAILGTGFSGLGMAIRLVKAGITTFTLYEKAGEVGGTWRDNTYPGLACDVPSHLYSFSFGPKTSWSRRYPRQPEILAYLQRCVREYGLRPHIRFNTEIADARFDDDSGQWALRTTGGKELSADVLVCGLGQLNRPRMPDIEGIREFEGTAFHSARWNHEHDLTDRTVAVIGNGASAAQFVPEIAKQAGKVYLFQRTPSWIAPKKDRRYSPFTRWVLDHVAPIRALYRQWLYWRQEMFFLPIRGGLGGRFGTAWARRHREDQVPDLALRARLTPDYPIGCKRVVMSDDFYPALARDNVELVTEPIDRITRTGIRTTDGQDLPVDTLIYGTGFHATGFLAPLAITGRDGTRLDEVWKEGAHAYLGMTIPRFPNLFLLYGPNTNLGHNSIILMIERQTGYVLRCVRAMGRRDLAWVSPRASAMADYDRDTQAALAKTVWNEGCTSWYKTETGKITNNWPHTTIRYWWATRRPRLEHYETGRDTDNDALSR